MRLTREGTPKKKKQKKGHEYKYGQSKRCTGAKRVPMSGTKGKQRKNCKRVS